MATILFWLFSALMLGFACAVIFNRNPVASALSLVVCFGGLAALFFMLDAYFIGTIQIQSQQLTLPGSLTLTSASGASVTLGTPVAAKNQPVPTGTLFNVPVATLASGTQYNLGWTITYPGSCLGPAVVKSATWGSFTTQ